MFLFNVILKIVKNNVKPTDVSVLRLVKCVTAVDATTISPVRISRTMYVIDNEHFCGVVNVHP